MPKKTGRRSPVPAALPNAISGLIATGKAPARSVEAKPAVDNRSHRTDSAQRDDLPAARESGIDRPAPADRTRCFEVPS
jgi:hypothetical protein